MSAEKSKQLGMSFSTAQNQLRKDIMFMLVQQAGLDKCYHCGGQIEKNNFSIEHKTPWMHSENPKELFFDLDNISFSHTKCNYGSARRNNTPKGDVHVKAVLTERDVYEIKHLAKHKVFTQAKIGKLYGVSRNTIECIVNNRAWVHVTI